ncbi:hypothetical protein E2C01_062273 [Portunus trituberculatus]|uniref:Uncharacterized protein n=1 Tax=Portunus trituberculatus TaxID=210409 RepID=A0A5B7H607_PORTR|nr:hypothetical protein [Portunus trituberculatus]
MNYYYNRKTLLVDHERLILIAELRNIVSLGQALVLRPYVKEMTPRTYYKKLSITERNSHTSVKVRRVTLRAMK